MVEGKVVARIPWIGYFGVWLNDALGVEGYYMIGPVTLILLLLFLYVEFAANLIGQRAAVVGQKLQPEKR